MFLDRHHVTPSGRDRRPVGDTALAIDIHEISRFLRRQKFVIATITSICLAGALIYVLTSTPLFTADAMVLVEPQKARHYQGYPASSELAIESALVDSQVEIAKSNRVLWKVIDELTLIEDPELGRPERSVVARLISTVRGGEGTAPASDEEHKQRLLEKFTQALSVRRVGLTHVLRISYQSEDPAKASRVANTLALAYVNDGIEAKSEAAKLASSWLDARVNELREQALEADRAAQRFRVVNRVAESYRPDFEVAKSKEQSPDLLLKGLVDQKTAMNETQIMLRALERDAHLSRVVYESFLTRRDEATQQQSFPIAEARIIGAAERPIRKSHPRTTLILGGALCLGLLGGVGAGILRERTDRTFRTGQQVEFETGVRCWGTVPLMKQPEAGLLPSLNTESSHAVNPELKRTETPVSPILESIRRVRIALNNSQLGRTNSVIGVVSALPNEGTTTLASNLAYSAAISGQSVLLIDANMGESSLTWDLFGRSVPGLRDLLRGNGRLEELLRRDAASNLSVLPVGSDAGDLLGSPEMLYFLKDKIGNFDLVLLDLPALTESIDVEAIAPFVDAFVLVIAWGETPRDIVLRALADASLVHQRAAGCVLNKVQMDALRRFERDEHGYRLPKG
jgi:uncharacterized protein involved in exopolysaccharide biosynthesis/Mrp family chromosome partitioning ATPase